MSANREELTAEQKLMHEVVNRIADKYTYSQTNLLITDAKQISNAIMSYKAPENTEK